MQGWPNHPLEGGWPPPCPKGVVRPPPKGHTKKKLAHGGWPDHPLGHRGGSQMAGLGVAEPPPQPRGWSGHPQKAKKKKARGCIFIFEWTIIRWETS
jgi:hypothetical protein